MTDDDFASWFRYIPVTPEARRWGFFVLDAGFTLIPPGSVYPPGKHPEGHAFTWESGRTLPSYTLVYVTRGQGRFESAAAGSKRIAAGQAFVLFPGEWHRYRPDVAVGWDEYWVEFDGEHARRIMEQRDLSPSRPVMTVGHDDAVLRLFLELNDSIRQSPPGFEHIIATQAEQIVARMLAAHRRNAGEDGESDAIRRACLRILEHVDHDIDFAKMACDLGLSHSGFRKKFQRVTGWSPGQYQQQVRLKRGCEWLRQTQLSVSEIATRLGYDSVYYFSRLFKRKMGVSPSEYRNGAVVSPVFLPGKSENEPSAVNERDA